MIKVINNFIVVEYATSGLDKSYQDGLTSACLPQKYPYKRLHYHNNVWQF
jgi:hypothetical protein